jgi:hypothetical protein
VIEVTDVDTTAARGIAGEERWGEQYDYMTGLAESVYIPI